MNAKGTVFRYGDNIDTDVIIPARYLNTQNARELAAHCMEDIDKTFVTRVQARRHHGGRRELRLRLHPRARAPGHQDRRRQPASSPPALPASSTATPSTSACPSWSAPPPAEAIREGDAVSRQL